jgi:hypothetical protein
MRDPSAFVEVARLYFDDDDVDRAVELLQYAAYALPGDERPWLARMEILFLRKEGHAFVAAARRFLEEFPKSSHWSEVVRLGWRLAPKELLFAAGRPEHRPSDAHYGAWPEVPNWIEAPWDLTSEVKAVELRGRILGTHAPEGMSAR